MSLYWYACIFINTYCYVIYNISLETVWWALFNTSLIVQICLVIHEILANEDFIITNGLISQFFLLSLLYIVFGTFQHNLVYKNWSTGHGDISWIKFCDTIEVNKVAEKWNIWDEEKEVAKSEEVAKKLILERFHKWIHVLEKKVS